MRWAALAGTAVLIAAGMLAWSRRKPKSRAMPAPDIISPPEPEPAPAPEPVATAEPVPAPAKLPEPAFAPAAPQAETADTLAFALEPTSLSATLVNATLAYRLVVTNRGGDPLADVAIAGDMISAHASRAMEEQLGITGPELAPLHRIAALAPGESVTLGGEMRLPLSAVLPIRNGDAQLFVPLARFDGWASAPAGRAVHARAAFLVGQEPDGSTRLQPFRLDLGPRVYARLGQRALAIPTTA